MSTVVVRLRAKPSKCDRFLEIFRSVADIVESDEPDCLIYALWETAVPNEYLLVESYRTEAGRTAHNERHGGVWREFMDCLAEEPSTEQLGAQVLGVPN